jgi:hypothetical protein
VPWASSSRAQASTAPGPGWRQQHEAVAADPGHRRLDHALHRDRRDRSIDGVAAGAQDVERGERRRRMRRCRHAALAVGDRSPRQREVTHATVPRVGSNAHSCTAPQRFKQNPAIRAFHGPPRNYNPEDSVLDRTPTRTLGAERRIR